MILADTSVWIDHLRAGDDDLRQLLRAGRVVMHPFVVCELALGSLPRREEVIDLIEQLPAIKLALQEEVRLLIEQRFLYNRGIGMIDAHLLASVKITPPTLLWTRDKRLRAVAEDFGIHTKLP